MKKMRTKRSIIVTYKYLLYINDNSNIVKILVQNVHIAYCIYLLKINFQNINKLM